MSIFQLSFSAAILIVAISIIRAVAINRIPKKTFLVLWAVVVLRLLIPFSVPIPFSVYSLISSTEVLYKMTESPAAYFLPLIPQTQNENNSVTLSSPFLSENTMEITASSNKPVPSAWMIVWSVGTGFCLLYFTIAYIRFYRRFQTSHVVKNNFTSSWFDEHKTIRSIIIKQSCRITTPLTYGILHPVILIPEAIDWSDEKQLKHILTHEYVHIRRFDTAIKLLLTVALCIHWFNPLVWVMYILANRDLELTCDETVVQHLDETSKASYALTLLKLEEQKNLFTPYYSGFSRNSTEERIVAIMKYKKSSITATLLAVILVVSTTTVFASSAIPFVNPNSLINQDEIERLTQKITERVTSQYNIDKIEAEVTAAINDEEIALMAQKAATAALVQHFESYSTYGLVFNPDDNRLYYKDQPVRYFAENYIEQVFNIDGVVDINATRNASGELVDVEPYNQQEFVEQVEAKLSEITHNNFQDIWVKACEAVYSGVIFWPLPDEKKEADWNYTAWSTVWNEEWKKAEAGGYVESLKDYVINSLTLAANNSGSWRNLHKNLYDTSIGLLEN